MEKVHWILYAVLIVAILAACGGGNGGAPDAIAASVWDTMVWGQGKWQ